MLSDFSAGRWLGILTCDCRRRWRGGLRSAAGRLLPSSGDWRAPDLPTRPACPARTAVQSVHLYSGWPDCRLQQTPTQHTAPHRANTQPVTPASHPRTASQGTSSSVLYLATPGGGRVGGVGHVCCVPVFGRCARRGASAAPARGGCTVQATARLAASPLHTRVFATKNCTHNYSSDSRTRRTAASLPSRNKSRLSSFK